MDTSTTDRGLLSARQAAERLGISTRKLWELSNRREIPVIRIGRAVRYSADDLRDYIDAQRVGGAR